MDRELLKNVNEYITKALGNGDKRPLKVRQWIMLNNKDFSAKQAIGCIYQYADGKYSVINDIIDHLTDQKSVNGKTGAAYASADRDVRKINIVYDGNGQLVLQGYDMGGKNDPLTLKGQHQSKNRKIFRKSDNQANIPYQKAEERFADLGKMVKELYPGASNTYITQAMNAIVKYSQQKKITYDKVIERIKKGRVELDDDIFVIRPIVRESKTIIIDESVIPYLKEALELTEYRFYNNIKRFLRDLLSDPVNADLCDSLKELGFTKSSMTRLLMRNHIIEMDERISDKDENGEPKTATMKIKYRVPKKGFELKLKKLYIKLFEKNLPEKVVTEDGATGSDASGQFVQPIFGVQRRTFADIEEATTTSTVGDYQYTVPFPGDDETLARKNGIGGSVSINKA